MSTTEFISTCPKCGERYIDHCKHCAKEEETPHRSVEKTPIDATDVWFTIIAWIIVLIVVAIIIFICYNPQILIFLGVVATIFFILKKIP